MLCSCRAGSGCAFTEALEGEAARLQAWWEALQKMGDKYYQDFCAQSGEVLSASCKQHLQHTAD